jgi:hypothetical protein
LSPYIICMAVFWTRSSRVTSYCVILVPQYGTASSTIGLICLQYVSCNSCRSEVKLASRLRSHILLYALSTMYFVFLSVTHEQVHILTYNCHICDFTCKTQDYIKQHTLVKHEGEAFLCSSCEFRAGSLSKLRSHKEQHNERCLKCPHCDYMGQGKNRLAAHMKRQSDPKYICKECDYKTYDPSNFKTHTTEKHGDVILKCSICDYKTKSRRGLNHHSEKHSQFLSASYK